VNLPQITRKWDSYVRDDPLALCQLGGQRRYAAAETHCEGVPAGLPPEAPADKQWAALGVHPG